MTTSTTIHDVLVASRNAADVAFAWACEQSGREALPRCAAEVRSIFRELTAAEASCSDHHRRFPRDPARPDDAYATTAPEGDAASEAGWKRCYARREAAREALLRYARALDAADAASAEAAAPDAAEVIS